ncbi:putative Cyclin-dependent kinase 2 [Blattamonas nauphoetae]|uniref:non-specific serine/threonine protein kinase n=1 Tax=Blattamonas nauphoetae TaxID=2049346 RepID=A0ABQ9XJ60_9EUKA|nr:putative Cyclin-dependent kinase 2 [Blattamonas nauphoetae]
MTQKGESMIPPGYTLVRPISEGAFGRVLEIKELSTGQSYALKLIPRLTEADEKRAEREVSLLKRFSNPRIVGLHESVVMETYHGIVMDLGVRNLKDLMTDFESRNELIPLEVTVQICIDIAEGLCVMHNHPTHPMAHGDLKPENVLLTEDNRAMLCDLGAADASGVNMSHSAKEVGTFEYNSPERLDDTDQRGTPASDIWSLGVMLHRMVTGQSLFGGGSLTKMVRAISEFDESKISKTIPDDIRRVLVRILDPIPDSRATSPQLFRGRQFDKMLGPETPRSKMQYNQIQNLEKKLAELAKENKSLQEHNPKLDDFIENLISAQIVELPPLIIYPLHGYQVKDQTFTRFRHTHEPDEDDSEIGGLVALTEPITSGIISVSVSLRTIKKDAALLIQLAPATGPLTSLGDIITCETCFGFASSNGRLIVDSKSTDDKSRRKPCHQPLKEGDDVVIEVNMDSNPRTVQFFVNGKAGKSYGSDFPESMRVMIWTYGLGISFRLNSITCLTTPTPIAPEMKAVPW